MTPPFTLSSPLTGRIAPSPNFGTRRGGRGIDMIVLHYTGCASAEAALLWMCAEESQVSAHYLVEEDGAIVQLVDEAKRAWHAGAAHWAGEADINSCSIGIEIHNAGHADDPLPPYPDEQIAAVIALCRDLMDRHGIVLERVVGHSDVAPARKADPGEHFPWGALAEAGVAFWTPPVGEAAGAALWPQDAGEQVAALQRDLRLIGYGVPDSGVYCQQTEAVVRAFQRRFVPDRVSGVADAVTRATLGRVAGWFDAA